MESLAPHSGHFWVEGLPLRPGANVLTLTATDAAGNVRSQTLTVNRSSVTLTIHEPSEAELARARLTVTGTISEAGYAVWVNGVRASLTPDGTVWAWRAEAVPLGEGGTAVLQARAIPLSHHNGAGDGGGPAGSTAQGNPADSTARDTELQRDRPARLYVMRYTENSQHSYGTCGGFRASYTTFMRVHHNSGGYRHCVYWDNAGGSVDHPYQYWTGLTDEGGCNVCDPESIYPHGDPLYWKEVPWEVCNVTDVQPRECVNDTYSRAARTILRLQTGGKGIAGRQLFSFTVNAWKFTNPREQPPYPQDSFVRAQITDGVDPSTIRVLGRPVGADGYLYEVLPDNAEFTVTPQASADFYLFVMTAQKHQHSLFYRVPTMSGLNCIDPYREEDLPPLAFMPRIGVLKEDVIEFTCLLRPHAAVQTQEVVWNGIGQGKGFDLSVTCRTLGTTDLEVRVKTSDPRRARVTVMEISPPNEDVWAAKHRLAAAMAYAYASEASTLADSLCSGHGVHNCRADAVRHSYWVALMCSSPILGPNVAIAAATAHERTNLEQGAPHNEIVMDMENNLRACSIVNGMNFPPEATEEQKKAAIQTAVRQAADSGQLTVLDDLTNSEGGGLLVPSSEQPY